MPTLAFSRFSLSARDAPRATIGGAAAFFPVGHLIIASIGLILCGFAPRPAQAAEVPAGGTEAAVTFDRRPEQGALLRGRAPPGSSIEFAGHRLPLTADGRFLLGFNRDANSAATLTVILPGGRRIDQPLRILAREYRLERVDGVPPESVTPPPEVFERIRREAALVADARQRIDERADWTYGFIWPAAGRLSGEYGSQRIYNGVPARPHYGVDIAAPTGDKAMAPADGLVTLAEADLYYSGGTVIIDHGHGLSSTLMHLSKVLVESGERVEKGQTIGLIGAGGRANGPHLDWRMNWLGRRVDPRTLFAADDLPPPREVAAGAARE